MCNFELELVVRAGHFVDREADHARFFDLSSAQVTEATLCED